MTDIQGKKWDDAKNVTKNISVPGPFSTKKTIRPRFIRWDSRAEDVVDPAWDFREKIDEKYCEEAWKEIFKGGQMPFKGPQSHDRPFLDKTMRLYPFVARKGPQMGLMHIPRSGVNWKAAWKTIGGKRKFFRSKWEANYATYLEFLKSQNLIKEWLHEPKIFWFEGIKRGVVSYLPDFQVFSLDGTHYWVEVKGYMDPKSRTKIKRFGKYFPQEELRVVDGGWFKANSSKLKCICKGWE